jgi:[acyl-carrier-protein] S-malonyltransferase
MGAALAAAEPRAQELFARAADVLGYDLLELCTNGPAEKLNSTEFSQPAIFVTSLAALEKLKQDSPQTVDECVATAGLSLGEYTALVFAGAMNFDAGLRVVQVRGQAMQDAANASPSGMVSVLGLERAQLEQLVAEARGNDVLQLSNFLCQGNIVVSGN